jgi:hypothetical protein
LVAMESKNGAIRSIKTERMLELELVVITEEQGQIVVAYDFNQLVLTGEGPEKTVYIIVCLADGLGFELVQFLDISIEYQLPASREIVGGQRIDDQVGVSPEIIPRTSVPHVQVAQEYNARIRPKALPPRILVQGSQGCHEFEHFHTATTFVNLSYSRYVIKRLKID